MKAQYIEISEYGNKYYFSDKEMKILHREDGPSIEYANGDKYWFLNGKLHREDGPAVEYNGGYKVWYLDGVRYFEEDFNKKINQTKTININGREFTVEELNNLVASSKF